MSFVRHGPAGHVYLINRTTNNLSIDITDTKPFMQYLFQQRQLHRIEFSGAGEKAHVGRCSFYLIVVPTPNEIHRNIGSYIY